LQTVTFLDDRSESDTAVVGVVMRAVKQPEHPVERVRQHARCRSRAGPDPAEHALWNGRTGPHV